MIENSTTSELLLLLSVQVILFVHSYILSRFTFLSLNSLLVLPQRLGNLLTASESFSENSIDMFSSMLKISLLLFSLYRLLSTVDEILWKKSIHFTSFPKEIFSIHF